MIKDARAKAREKTNIFSCRWTGDDLLGDGNLIGFAAQVTTLAHHHRGTYNGM
jgi:hypothetical protein